MCTIKKGAEFVPRIPASTNVSYYDYSHNDFSGANDPAFMSLLLTELATDNEEVQLPELHAKPRDVESQKTISHEINEVNRNLPSLLIDGLREIRA